MRVIERVDQYMKEKGLNDNKVTVQLGLAIGTIGKSRKEGRDLSKKVVAKILKHYNDLDEAWLLTGEGSMLCEPRVEEKPELPTEKDFIEQVGQQGFTLNPTTFEKLVDQYCVTSSTIKQLVNEISKAHDLVSKSQEQMDKMIDLVQLDKKSRIEIEAYLRKKLEEKP